MSYLSPVLAIVAGVVHAGLAPVIVIGGVTPNLILVAVVLVTCFGGLLTGIVWAFVGGVTVNLMVGEPLGAIPLALLIVAALIHAGSRAAGRTVVVYAVVATFAGSLVADAVAFFVSQLVTDAIPAAPPIEILLAAAVLNTAIAGLLVIPARAVAARYASEESPAW